LALLWREVAAVIMAEVAIETNTAAWSSFFMSYTLLVFLNLLQGILIQVPGKWLDERIARSTA